MVADHRFFTIHSWVDGGGESEGRRKEGWLELAGRWPQSHARGSEKITLAREIWDLASRDGFLRFGPTSQMAGLANLATVP